MTPSPTSTTICRATVAAPILALAALALLPATRAQAATINGTVKSGTVAIKRAPVTLLRSAGDRQPVVMGKGRSDGRGKFAIRYRKQRRSGDLVYAVSGVLRTSRRRDVRLASVPRSDRRLTQLTLNERTTVAAGFGEAQFVSGWSVNGPSPGPQNASMMAGNLANARTGRLPGVLRRAPNGNRTPTQATFDSLANMLAGCARREARCKRVLKLMRAPGDRRTDSILRAVANVARSPANNVGRLFKLSLSGPTPYSPALGEGEKPTHWALMLRFVGDRRSMDGPGNIAFDADGNAWVANNYTYGRDPRVSQCGSKQLLKFRPDGSYEPGSPYSGGGLSGVGYGLTFDPDGKLWLGNFGFASPGCTDQPPHNSVSRFNLSGKARPDRPITAGKLSWPQGTVSNDAGDIWIANCGPFNSPLSETIPHDSFTIYPGGDPAKAQSFRDPNLDKPFDVAFNVNGKAFISSTQSNLVGMYDDDGTPTAKSPITGGGIQQPMGVASDSRGNIWVSNSALIDLPCPGATISLKDKGGSVSLIDRHGNLLSPDPTRRNPNGGFTGGGAAVPWGMAIDGNDNVWVSNFGKQRVSQFCGVPSKRCGTKRGKKLGTGDPISPKGGWGFSGLTRNTATEIDPSGNVWITNNWRQIPIQTNPGGYQMVVMVGAAGPVRTPLIGQPEPLR